MLIIKSLNVRLCILYIFKNSIGTNKTNNETQNRIKNQNKPCAFQVMTDFSTIPTDSSKRYVEYPKMVVPSENKYNPNTLKKYFF